LLGVQAGAPPGPVRAELDGVGKSYPSPRGQQAIFRGVTHSFRAGTLTGLIGRSGSGKTTLLHVLAGLERPTAGRVSVLGDDLAARSRAELARLRRNAVALVTQEPGLIPYLTALENVELGIRLRSAAPGQARAEEALHQVGLDERRHHRASDLSAGERERVAIARALAADTAILLVDEPTARLDEENAHAIGLLLVEAAHVHGLAVVCATHDQALIEAMDETMRLD
jgi:ABC-type lipoprotein export system ATPase subunit